MGSGGEDRLGTGRNYRDTAELDEHTGNVGKNRNDESEGDTEEEQSGGFTRSPSIVSFPAGKFADYNAYNLGLSSAAQVWVAEIKVRLDALMRSHNIAGVSTIQSRSACAKTENPGDLSGEASMMTINRRRPILGTQRVRAALGLRQPRRAHRFRPRSNGITPKRALALSSWRPAVMPFSTSVSSSAVATAPCRRGPACKSGRHLARRACRSPRS